MPTTETWTIPDCFFGVSGEINYFFAGIGTVIRESSVRKGVWSMTNAGIILALIK